MNSVAAADKPIVAPYRPKVIKTANLNVCIVKNSRERKDKVFKREAVNW